jgi:hypothetical protein
MMTFARYGEKNMFPTTNQMRSPPVPSNVAAGKSLNKMEVFDGTIINIKAACAIAMFDGRV